MSSSTVLIGNVTRDPELRYTPNGQATVSFGVAVNRSWKDKAGEWKEETSFFDVVAWKDAAEHIAESITRGMRVICVGRLEQRTWETQDGSKRSKVELVADEVGASTRYGVTTFEKREKASDVTGDGSPF